jgi:hypothetical protein
MPSIGSSESLGPASYDPSVSTLLSRKEFGVGQIKHTVAPTRELSHHPKLTQVANTALH